MLCSAFLLPEENLRTVHCSSAVCVKVKPSSTCLKTLLNHAFEPGLSFNQFLLKPMSAEDP